jgi:hypothetical protein
MAKKKVSKPIKSVPRDKDPRFNHELNVKNMIARYGYDSNWVTVEMYLTYDEMIKYFGKMCEEYEPLCANCENWLKWNKTGKAEIVFERDELLKIM